MDSIPQTIPFSLVDLGDRGRVAYNNLEALADSIEQLGLINPLVIEPYMTYKSEQVGPFEMVERDELRYLIRAGGRRYSALRLLGVETLYHGTSSDPTRPGFLLANVASDKLKALLIELGENHDREDTTWREELPLIVQGYWIWHATEQERDPGCYPLQRQFGALCGVNYTDVKQALALHEDYEKEPEAYAEAGTIRAAYGVFLKRQANLLAAQAAKQSFKITPAYVKPEPTKGVAPVVEGETAPLLEPPLLVQLSSTMHLGNGLDYLRSLAPDSIDHIITDPDFGIATELLNAGTAHGGASEGVAQATPEQSWNELQQFVTESFRVTRHFCVFWYDLDYHERLQALALRVGWRAQRWPLIWDRTDHRSNAAPSHNFCKHIEYAMVLRKPGTTLTKAQMRVIYACPGNETVKRFGHPFAKPIELWTWLFKAFTIEGQTVVDPFAGKGSCPVAALRYGLKPSMAEISEVHFNDLTLNMQGEYRKKFGINLRFE